MKDLLSPTTFDSHALEAIDRDITRASLHAGNLCKHSFRAGKWHTSIAQAREKVNILQQMITAHRNKLDMSKVIVKLQKKLSHNTNFEIPSTYKECQETLQKVQKSIQTMIKSDKDLRKAELKHKATVLAGLDTKDKQAKILRRLI